MTVLEVLKAVEGRATSVEELAQQYSVSVRTVQKKIAGLGYKWNAKERLYEYVGEGEESEVSGIAFDALFTKGASNSLLKQRKATTSHSNKERGNVVVKQGEELDSVDILLRKSKRNDGRVYRGYYLDKDILSVIETVDSGSRSDLVNECLRKVFKDKGLL